MVLSLKTCFNLDYRSVILKTHKSDKCSLVLKYIQAANLLRPVPSYKYYFSVIMMFR